MKVPRQLTAIIKRCNDKYEVKRSIKFRPTFNPVEAEKRVNFHFAVIPIRWENIRVLYTHTESDMDILLREVERQKNL